MLAIQFCSMVVVAQDEGYSELGSAFESVLTLDEMMKPLSVFSDFFTLEDASDEDIDQTGLIIHDITPSPAVETVSGAITKTITKSDDLIDLESFADLGINDAEQVPDVSTVGNDINNTDHLQEVGKKEKKDTLGEEIQRKLSLILNKTKQSTNHPMIMIRPEYPSRHDILMLLENKPENINGGLNEAFLTPISIDPLLRQFK